MPKTIFGTTEKSNFILNMTQEGYWNWDLRVLTLFMILMPCFSVLLECAKVYSVPGMALAITGVFAIVFVFIGYMKKVTPKKLLAPALLAAGMVAWGVVSLLNGYSYTIGILGADGRSEGALSFLFYGCFFLLGAQLGTDRNRIRLLRAAQLMGLAECLWALLQVLPIGFPSYYKDLEPLLLFRVFLPSGLTGSPIFFAILLVMLAYPSFLGAVYDEEKKARVLHTVCAAVFTLFAVRTQVLVGLAGTVLMLLLALVHVVRHKGGHRAWTRLGGVLCAAVLAFGWSTLAPQINGTYGREGGENVASSGQMLYDGAVMSKDGSYRLSVAGYYMAGYQENPNGTYDATDIASTYGYLWRTTGKVIAKYPLVGSGPDQLVYPQLFHDLAIMSNNNTFDRAYDYYLQLAATCGIPMLLLFLGICAISVVRGAKETAKRRESWITAGLFGAVVLYLLMMVIGTSSITVAPVFWDFLGCCADPCAYTPKTEETK